MLGVSPRVLRDDYCMVDLPGLLHKKTQQIAENRLAMLHIICAPNMKEDSFTELVQQLSWSLQETTTQTDELDRAGLEALRNRIGRR